MRKQSQAKQKAWLSVTNRLSPMVKNPTDCCCVGPIHLSSLWANLSKDSIKLLISKLKYKARDTKLIHQIITRLNRTWQAAKQVGCDVQKLYPSVENNVWIPAVRRMLERYPNPEFVPTDLIIEALEICLEKNFCEFCNDYFKVNSGTAMGPCHSCD